MRAAVITKFNAPWELQDVADPRPSDGQVVIKIEASGMCGTDMHVHHGMLGGTLPIIAGHEPVGRIVELGPGVTDLRVGDRVGVPWVQKGCGRCAMCQAGRLRFCPSGQTWQHLGGGNSELMLAWADGCVLVPEGVSSEAAAPVFCAGYTVMSGYRDAQPRTGERVAVLGIGGLGHLAVQMAKALGHETIAVTGSPGKRDEAKALGADEVVVSGDHAGKSLMAAGGADIILSTSNGGAQVNQALSGLRPGGRLVILGLFGEPLALNLFELMFPPRQVLGGSQGDRRDLVDMLGLVAAGKVKPALEVYKMDKVNEVRDRLDAGKVRYRAVLTHS